MLAHPNRLWSQPNELYDANGVTFEDRLVRKEAGASLYNAVGLSSSPQDSATIASSQAWAGAVGVWRGTSTPTFVKHIATGTNTGAVVTITVPGGGVAVGNTIVIAGMASSATSTTISSVTDSKGNTYTVHGGGSRPGDNLYALLASSISIIALVGGDTIVVTFSDPGFLGHIAIASEYTLVTTFDQIAVGNASSATITINIGSALAPYVIVASHAKPNSGGSITPAGTPVFTEINETTTTFIHGQSQYRIDATSPTIVALYDWWPDTTTQRLITAALDGAIYKDDNAGNLSATTLVSGLSTTARPGRLVSGGKEAAANNRKLFYFNGTNSVRVLSGNGGSMTVITTPPADWASTNQPVNGIIHRFRLVGFGNVNDPHRIYISDPDNHELFTGVTTSTVRANSQVGDRLFCAAHYQGLLYLWKYPRGIFYLDDTTDTLEIRDKSAAVGCAASQYAVLEMDDDVMFLAADGNFHMLSAVATLGGVRASDLTYRLGLSKWLRDNLNLTRLNQVESVWFPQKKLALWGLPGVGSMTNNLTLKFDFGDVEDGGNVKFSYSQRDAVEAFTQRRSASDAIERPIFGAGGFVYLMEQAARDKDGVAYTGTFQTPHLDFSHLDPKLRYTRKLYEQLELIMEPVLAGTITAQVYVDTVLRQTISFNATLRRQKRLLRVGDGHTISVKVTNSVLDEDFQVDAILVYCKLGNEDASR